ncbi:hypothetical protein [Sediminibacillus terrae]|uniref:hypothetical protein n=1 Tax=Sediminibacillus terrae TaxID=1562106 RepID=UPI001295CAAD|nr:hypothetical protein [Sediminibacillus terrae]
MKNETYRFYADRWKNGFLAILFSFLIFILFSKVLNDTSYMTGTGVTVSWIIVGLSFLFAVICLIRTIDPRPIVEVNDDGLRIQTFLFWKEFVSWEEILEVKKEKYTQRASNITLNAHLKVTSYFLRVYRPNKRSIAINLSLLNKRGNEFNEVIGRYMKVNKTVG